MYSLMRHFDIDCAMCALDSGVDPANEPLSQPCEMVSAQKCCQKNEEKCPIHLG